ncbi:hypothetical protein Focb16_v009941 [Fusarium oxysporum f. sp. cubense]|uniref:Uncharacterized protein n=1 Tax=Fusarium oxysporum f. sp. cubense TaxID=61366 RepID=A0A559L120_FUSOC|nr:hypothetical protein Focb16_v009941 [Fusarium oxysporum f. sp. cubense]
MYPIPFDQLRLRLQWIVCSLNLVRITNTSLTSDSIHDLHDKDTLVKSQTTALLSPFHYTPPRIVGFPEQAMAFTFKVESWSVTVIPTTPFPWTWLRPPIVDYQPMFEDKSGASWPVCRRENLDLAVLPLYPDVRNHSVILLCDAVVRETQGSGYDCMIGPAICFSS